MQVDFNGAKTIHEIDLFTVQDNYGSPSTPTAAMTFTQYGITDFNVQYWDGSNWLPVPNGSITGNNLVWRKLQFSALNTTSIRVQVNNALSSYSRVTEVEAYGVPSTVLSG